MATTPGTSSSTLPRQPNAVQIEVENQPDPTVYQDKPMTTTCPTCEETVTTKVVYTSGITSWIICMGMIFWGMWCGCCLVPFFINGCRDCEHYCPLCESYIGKFIREEKQLYVYDNV